MKFPKISESLRLERLQPPNKKIRMVLDTDTYNEIDDQFAVVYALKSSDRMKVEALYAAPFNNDRSSGPENGMIKSYEEILRLLERLDVPSEGFVYQGSKGFLPDLDHPYSSEAAQDLIKRAMEPGDDPLYVVAIGAITNVASAILLEPRIIERIVVLWLGGHTLHWPNTREFNLAQDIYASRLVFDCGVPLIQIPCMGVASHLLTTVPELERHIQGKGAIADYLLDTFQGYHHDHYAWAKEIWDISTIGYLNNPDWVPTQLIHSPILTDQLTWSHDASRHFIRSAYSIDRNAIFRDLFKKL